MKLSSVDRTITVESATVHLGEILPEYVRKNILRIAGKYFGRLNAATVYFKKEGITYHCTVNMQMGALRIMSGEAKNIPAAALTSAGAPGSTMDRTRSRE